MTFIARWRNAIPTSTNANATGRRRWRSSSHRPRRPTCAWRSTCRERSGTRRAATRLVELMIANDPGYRDEKAAIAQAAGRPAQFVTTMVVRERSGEPRPTHIHLGGDFTRKGERVAPGVPAVLPRLEDAQSRVSAGPHGPGPLAGRSPQSADGTGRRQPDLASLFRPRPGRDRQRLRHARDAADPSRAARLAGLRARRPGLEPEGDPPPDRELGDLPAGVDGASARDRRSIPTIGCSGGSRGCVSTPS